MCRTILVIKICAYNTSVNLFIYNYLVRIFLFLIINVTVSYKFLFSSKKEILITLQRFINVEVCTVMKDKKIEGKKPTKSNCN